MNVKIGFIQFSPPFCDREAAIEKIDQLVRFADHADLLVLPELCNSGYNFESFEQAWKTSEDVENSVFLQTLETIAAEKKVFLVAGINEREGKALYNTAVLISPEGTIGKYRKMHLFTNEWDFFQPGNLGLPIFDIGICKIGILICFDWIFPEVWRILALKGADLICHPSNLVIPGLCQRAIPIHSLTNRIFIITANRIGSERNLNFTGLSIITDPKGNILYQASASEEEVGIVEVDPHMSRDKMVTARNHIFRDRRPEEYSCLTKSENEGK